MLDTINLKDILFLDIETVPQTQNYNDLDEEVKILWEQKSKYQRKEEFSAEQFYERAGIWAEFGKIICISVGFFDTNKSERNFRITSFHGEENKILQDFKNLLDKHFCTKNNYLCAHNGKEFDFPFIARRMVVHNIQLPFLLNLYGKKPWEIYHLDTLELWKFGDYKHYTSLKLLTSIFGIPSPKDDIDGSQVAQVYYKEKNLKRIVDYCEKDTIAVAQVFLKFKRDQLLLTDEIKYIEYV